MNTSITPQTTVSDLVDFWLQQLRAGGRLEGTTIDEYGRASCAISSSPASARRASAPSRRAGSTNCSSSWARRA